LYSALQANRERLVLPGRCMISRDGRRGVTTSDGMPIEVWDLTTGTEIAKRPDNSESARAFSDDGKWVAVKRLPNLPPDWSAPLELDKIRRQF
jgi:hypothetical protein